MKAIYPALTLVLVLAACSSTPPPVPAPVPTPTARPAPVPLPPRTVGDWRDAPITPGEWRYFDDRVSTADMPLPPRRPWAMFGTSRNDDLVLIICNRSKDRIELSVPAPTPESARVATPIRVITTTGTRALMSDPALSTNLALGVALRPTDPILDAMAFSRGRFAIEIAGAPPLALPSWPEVSRVIEDCR